MRVVAQSSRRIRTELAERLRAAGLRCTPQRIAVLSYLHTRKAPTSHGELTEDLETTTGFDRATLYRNLMDLARTGLVQRSDHGDHIWRFELTKGEDHEHPHFVCESCGDVSCLSDVDVRVVAGITAPRSVKLRRVAVRLKGLCNDCIE